MAVTAAALVERFYDVVWNKADEQAAREILDPDFIFRASLGPELRGPEGFIAYLRSVHAALENFICTIEDLIATEDRAAAKMRFTGTHRAKFFGVEATGRAHSVERGCVLYRAQRPDHRALGTRRRRSCHAAGDARAHAARFFDLSASWLCRSRAYNPRFSAVDGAAMETSRRAA